jgi:hypothetical protein
MTQLDRIAKEWRAAREVIASALGEWYGGSPDRLQQRAAAIIARLAAHNPPILLEMEEADEPDQDEDYTGPVCSHCRKPVNAHNGIITSGLRQTWLCDSCAAAAEMKRDGEREERE